MTQSVSCESISIDDWNGFKPIDTILHNIKVVCTYILKIKLMSYSKPYITYILYFFIFIIYIS